MSDAPDFGAETPLGYSKGFVNIVALAGGDDDDATKPPSSEKPPEQLADKEEPEEEPKVFYKESYCSAVLKAEAAQ